MKSSSKKIASEITSTIKEATLVKSSGKKIMRRIDETAKRLAKKINKRIDSATEKTQKKVLKKEKQKAKKVEKKVVAENATPVTK